MRIIKKLFCLILAAALILAAVACTGGNEPAATKAPETEAPATGAPETDAPATQAPVTDPETEALAVYSDIIAAYRTAVEEEWSAEQLLDEGMGYMYAGRTAAEVGYAFIDADNDGSLELILGRLADAEYPSGAVYDMYAVKDGAVTSVFTAGERDRYYLCRDEAGENLYIFANEGSDGAAHTLWRYLTFAGGELAVVQTVTYDASADAANPWYIGTDDDDDVSNDTHTDEATAKAVMDGYEAITVAPEYVPFAG